MTGNLSKSYETSTEEWWVKGSMDEENLLFSSAEWNCNSEGKTQILSC